MQSGEGASPSSRHLAGGLRVDDVSGREIKRLLAGEGDREPGHGGLPLVADHDVRLALADGLGQPRGPHGRHPFVQGVEPGIARSRRARSHR